VHCKRDSRRGVVNNQVLDWSFKLDGVIHNASQDQVYDKVAASILTKALDGYNGEDLTICGKYKCHLHYVYCYATAWSEK
jgi:hypothetical protein